MELRNLITFVYVAELGSFTKAAQQLDYSQSTVSFQIKQLEDELGCLLFERINHTITLTERGHELMSYAHRIRALTEEFLTSIFIFRKCGLWNNRGPAFVELCNQVDRFVGAIGYHDGVFRYFQSL